MSSDAQQWEDAYVHTRPEALPWNAGGPDSDLVRLVKAGEVAPGQALDIGTGLGHDAVFLIQQGFNVIGIDISPAAVTLARENASGAGLFGFFQQGDLRHIPVEDAFVEFAYDRGCFHVLGAADRAQAIAEVLRVLRRRGLYFLKVFSDKEPGTAGPSRFTKHELETLFTPRFRILKLWESTFEGPAKPQAYGMLMEKK